MLSRTFTQFLALTQNALRDALSNRLFLGVLVFAVLAISATGVVGALSLHQEERLFNDLILLATAVFLAGLSVYQGGHSLHREIQSRTIFTVLSKPVSRSNFVIGKFIGSFAAIAIALISIFALQMGAAFLLGYSVTEQHFDAYYGLLLQLAIVIALAMFFSSFSSPVLSSIFTGAIFIAGSLTPQLREAIEFFAKKESPAKYVAEAAVVLLPDLHKMNLSFELTHGIEIPTDYLLAIGGYSLAYTAALLTLTCIIFERRDFS